jgi:FkbM family methyltransferase
MKRIHLLKEAINISKEFGFSHAYKRFIDYELSRAIDRKKNKIYRRQKPKGKIVCNILGHLIRLNMNDYGIHRDLFLDGIREPVATAHTMRTISSDDVVLEIGANIGYYVLINSQICHRVYAVEPHPTNFEELKYNIHANLCKNVELYQLAFGEKKCKQLMYCSEKANWHSFRPPIKKEKVIEVQMDTADNFLQDKLKPSYARMDVEGFELNVLKGMKKTLPNLKRLFIELHSDMIPLKETREVIDIITESGMIPELIVKYDKPMLSQILSPNHIDLIYRGDKAVYEIFFLRR